jgi:hypothetical protein
MARKRRFVAPLLLAIALGLGVAHTWADDGQPAAPPDPPKDQTQEPTRLPSATTIFGPPAAASATQAKETTQVPSPTTLFGPAESWLGNTNLVPEYHDVAARFGYWGSISSGSPAPVGLYENLSPSPFWDVDGLLTNGIRTLDFGLNQLDQDAFNARGYFYGPSGLEIRVGYDHFLSQFPHDRFPNMVDAFSPTLVPSVPPGDNSTDPQNVVKQDLSVGQDYAIRVSEFRNTIKYNVTENLRVRLDLWGMQKEGFRQANAMSQCFSSTQDPLPPGHDSFVWGNSPKCHVLSQPQHIDWSTFEVKPVVEYKFGNVTVEYSRPMRWFTQNDQAVFRTYGGDMGMSTVLDTVGGPVPYGVVPNSTNMFDQLKIAWKVNDTNRFYAYLFDGTMKDEEIDLSRFNAGADLRWTNTSIKNLSITPYARFVKDWTQAPNIDKILAAVPENSLFPGPGGAANFPNGFGSLQNIDRDDFSTGVRGAWQPFGPGFGLSHLRITGGYQYEDLHRTGTFDDGLGAPPFVEPYTISNQVWLRPAVSWSTTFDTFLQYKQRWVQTPLYASRANLESGGNLTNSSLPTDEEVAEVGVNWYPTRNFYLSATFGYDNRDHNDSVTVFHEQSYPYSVNAWYRVTPKWSLTAGYADFTDFIAQDINNGDVIGNGISQFTGLWRYAGREHVFHAGTTYAWTARVLLTARVEWVDGIDRITQAQGTSADLGFQTFDFIPQAALQSVQTVRVITGVDWHIRERVAAYFRYIFDDYEDRAQPTNSGQVHFFLGGFSAFF